MKEVLATKSIRLGRDYVLDSQHNVVGVAGIHCFDEAGMNEQRLIVLEANKQPNDDVGCDDDFLLAFSKMISLSTGGASPRTTPRRRQHFRAAVAVGRLRLPVNIALAFVRLPRRVCRSSPPQMFAEEVRPAERTLSTISTAGVFDR